MSIVVTSNSASKAADVAITAKAAEENKEAKPAASETPAETIEASDASKDEELEPEVEGEAEGKTPEAKPKAKKGYKKRIDKLNKRLADAEREREYFRGLAEQKRTPDGPKPEVVKAKESNTGEPDSESFDSHADYVKALTKWQLAEDRKELDAKTRVEKSKTEFKSKQDSLFSSIDEAKKKFADYDEVIEAAEDVKFTEALQFLVMESENPGELMYALAKDREELEKLSNLPLEKLERALGRFEAKIEPKGEAKPATSVEKRASKAPEPIAPVGNKGAGAGKKSITDPNLSQREYEAIRMEQIKSKSSSW